MEDVRIINSCDNCKVLSEDVMDTPLRITLSNLHNVCVCALRYESLSDNLREFIKYGYCCLRGRPSFHPLKELNKSLLMLSSHAIPSLPGTDLKKFLSWFK